LTSPAAKQTPRSPIPGVRAPRPLLPAAIEKGLTPRQRQVLDSLEELIASEGLADSTMAQIAAQVNCSLRTLYGISPSKDELVLTVADRWLHRIGREAMALLDPDAPALETLRAYLRAAHAAVGPSAATFGRELASVPGARRQIDRHENYVTAVVKRLLDQAVEEASIAPVDTAAVALVLGGIGRDFTRPEVLTQIAKPSRETADALIEIVLRGLERP